jgi:hypothetical protein
VDSKLSQLEQIKEQQKQKQMLKDLDNAWNEVRHRSNFQRTERESFIEKCRLQESLSIQEFQKNQMADRIERSLKFHDDYNEERKQAERMRKEDYEQEQEMMKSRYNKRKTVKEEIQVI